MQISNGLPFSQTPDHWRTEASAFDSGAGQGSRNMYRRQQGKQQNADTVTGEETKERTLPAIKPGVVPSGGALRKEMPPAAAGELTAGGDGITPLPTLRRRSEAYERMLNIF